MCAQMHEMHVYIVALTKPAWMLLPINSAATTALPPNSKGAGGTNAYIVCVHCVGCEMGTQMHESECTLLLWWDLHQMLLAASIAKDPTANITLLLYVTSFCVAAPCGTALPFIVWATHWWLLACVPKHHGKNCIAYTNYPTVGKSTCKCPCAGTTHPFVEVRHHMSSVKCRHNIGIQVCRHASSTTRLQQADACMSIKQLCKLQMYATLKHLHVESMQWWWCWLLLGPAFYRDLWEGAEVGNMRLSKSGTSCAAPCMHRKPAPSKHTEPAAAKLDQIRLEIRLD